MVRTKMKNNANSMKNNANSMKENKYLSMV